MCRKAMPRAMSKANFTACIWSTTKSAGREGGGQLGGGGGAVSPAARGGRKGVVSAHGVRGRRADHRPSSPRARPGVAAGGPPPPPEHMEKQLPEEGETCLCPPALCVCPPPSALTCPLVQHVVEGAVGHPVADDDGVRRRGGLAGAQHRQHVGVREDPAREATAPRSAGAARTPLPRHLLPSVPRRGVPDTAPTRARSPVGLLPLQG